MIGQIKRVLLITINNNLRHVRYILFLFFDRDTFGFVSCPVFLLAFCTAIFNFLATRAKIFRLAFTHITIFNLSAAITITRELVVFQQVVPTFARWYILVMSKVADENFLALPDVLYRCSTKNS